MLLRIYDGKDMLPLRFCDGAVGKNPLAEKMPCFAVRDDMHAVEKMRVMDVEVGAHRGGAALGKLDIVAVPAFRRRVGEHSETVDAVGVNRSKGVGEGVEALTVFHVSGVQNGTVPAEVHMEVSTTSVDARQPGIGTTVPLLGICNRVRNRPY